MSILAYESLPLFCIVLVLILLLLLLGFFYIISFQQTVFYLSLQCLSGVPPILLSSLLHWGAEEGTSKKKCALESLSGKNKLWNTIPKPQHYVILNSSLAVFQRLKIILRKFVQKT